MNTIRRVYLHERGNSSPPRRSGRRPFQWALVCLAATIILAGARRQGQQTPASGPEATNPTSQSGQGSGSGSIPKAPIQKAAGSGGGVAATAGDMPIAEESARLVKMATDLKSEVAKTNKDTLSMQVIRKAEEIERLAHNVRERMKRTAQLN